MRDVAKLLIVARLLVVVLVAGWLAGCAGAGGRGRGRGRGRAGRAGRGVAPTRARVKGRVIISIGNFPMLLLHAHG